MQQAGGESWPVKSMRGLLATAGLSADYEEKAQFISATTEYLLRARALIWRTIRIVGLGQCH